MDSHWLVLLIIIAVVLFIIGNFSTVHKTAKKPLRRQSLNDLKETLPRSNRDVQQKNTKSFGKTPIDFNEQKQKSSD